MPLGPSAIPRRRPAHRVFILLDRGLFIPVRRFRYCLYDVQPNHADCTSSFHLFLPISTCLHIKLDAQKTRQGSHPDQDYAFGRRSSRLPAMPGDFPVKSVPLKPLAGFGVTFMPVPWRPIFGQV